MSLQKIRENDYYEKTKTMYGSKNSDTWNISSESLQSRNIPVRFWMWSEYKDSYPASLVTRKAVLQGRGAFKKRCLVGGD